MEGADKQRGRSPCSQGTSEDLAFCPDHSDAFLSPWSPLTPASQSVSAQSRSANAASLETGGSLPLPITLSLSLRDSGDSGMETAKTPTRTETRDQGDRPPPGPSVH